MKVVIIEFVETVVLDMMWALAIKVHAIVVEPKMDPVME